MSERLREAAGTVWHSWWVFVARWYIKRTYDDLPGPKWFRVALIVICLLIPGELDEVLLLALLAGSRALRKYLAARKVEA